MSISVEQVAWRVWNYLLKCSTESADDSISIASYKYILIFEI